MSILVILETEQQGISTASLSAVTAAQQIGGAVDVLVLGHQIAAAVRQAASIDGIHRVLTVDHADLAHLLAENIARMIVDIASDFTHILAGASSFGKSMMPRLAALLDVMQISEITAVKSADIFERLIYAGNAVIEVQSRDAIKVLTVRSTKFKPTALGSSNAPVVSLSVKTVDVGLSRFISSQSHASDRPELVTARVVVSGGRGLQSKENFDARIKPLAAKLHAAIGASRAAVDAGFCPNDLQVGQTGKVVAPEVYVAVGISGAIQHIAGMQDSRVIFAINKDIDAPIFKVADFGLVADLNEVIPEIINA